MPKIDHVARAREAWPHLVKRAREMREGRATRAFTYSEISKLIGVHYRAATHFLSIIQKYCKEAGLPKLQSLVVNAISRNPGEGYCGDPNNLEADQKAAIQHNWPDQAPF